MKLALYRRMLQEVKAQKLADVMKIISAENARREKLRPKSGRLGKPLPIEEIKPE